MHADPDPVRPQNLHPRQRLILAVDIEDSVEAMALVRRMAPHVGLIKIGPRLFMGGGRAIVDAVRAEGCDVFLDLKLHDIPATVSGAVREIVRLGVKMFTVHALGGERMLSEASKVLAAVATEPAESGPMMLAVTILTSHTPEDLSHVGLPADIPPLVGKLADLAVSSGAQGIVASGHEVRHLREHLPRKTVFVTPGIRSPADTVDDQARVMTPGEAIRAGATYVVVGRPIYGASDPVSAAQRIVDDIEGALP